MDFLVEEGGGSNREEEEAPFSPSLDQSRSELSSISCQGHFDWDLRISAIKFYLTKWKESGSVSFLSSGSISDLLVYVCVRMGFRLRFDRDSPRTN